ncbi:MAG: hypothetical protein ACI4XM_05770 [Candidatus Coprovivens sp.]
MDNKNRIVDKFLDKYAERSSRKTELVKVYVKPAKWRSCVGFIISTIFFLLLLTIFTIKFYYFVMLFVSLIIAIYYGINLFTEKGLGLPRTIEVVVEEDDSIEESELNNQEKSDRYKVQ